MKLKARFETYQQTKKALKINLIIDGDRNDVIKNLNNFFNKPLIIDMNIDASQAIIEASQITDDQRAKIYAMIKDYSKETGAEIESIKQDLKAEFCQEKELELFSLSDCSFETAYQFIEWLIEYGLTNGLLKHNPAKYFKNIESCFAVSVKVKKCIVCGNVGEIHHIDTIGMGRDRNTVNDDLNRKVCLCRGHHTEAHTIGFDEALKKWGFV